jgi:hypothetical protein
MAHPYHHAVSSARKFGGTPADYQSIHDWFDIIWTVKPCSDHSSTELVVPVVHRRGPAARVARINAQAERAAGRCLWTHRGDPGAALTLA